VGGRVVCFEHYIVVLEWEDMFIVEIPQCTDILEMVLDFNIHCDLTTFTT
jgi:hypothetical protein